MFWQKPVSRTGNFHIFLSKYFSHFHIRNHKERRTENYTPLLPASGAVLHGAERFVSDGSRRRATLRRADLIHHCTKFLRFHGERTIWPLISLAIKHKMLLDDARTLQDRRDGDGAPRRMIRESNGNPESLHHIRNGEEIRVFDLCWIRTRAFEERNIFCSAAPCRV